MHHHLITISGHYIDLIVDIRKNWLLLKFCVTMLQQKVFVRGGQKEEEPLEMVVYNQGMFKTELCNKWQETGTCPYGDHCQFAHGIGELRPVIRHPRYKTEVCRMVLAGVVCPYGHRCHFRHALTEQEKAMSQPKPRSMKLERWMVSWSCLFDSKRIQRYIIIFLIV